MLKVGDRNRPAGYLEGTGTTELVFAYEVIKGTKTPTGERRYQQPVAPRRTIKDPSKIPRS